MLHLRKSSQTHGAPTNVLLNALELAGNAESTKGTDRGIKQAKEKQGEIGGVAVLPPRVLKTGMQPLLINGGLQSFAKMIDQSPMSEVFLGEREVAIAHGSSEPEVRLLVQ